MADTLVLLSFARILTAALAGVIAIVAMRAFLRTRQRSVGLLATGTGLLAAGYLAEGLLVEVVDWTIAEATVLESITTLTAATVLVASLYLRDAVVTRPEDHGREPPAEDIPRDAYG